MSPSAEFKAGSGPDRPASVKERLIPYLWAVLVVAGGVFLRALLTPEVGHGLPFITLFPALFVVAYLVRWVAAGQAGRGAAVLNPAHTAELARLREEVDQLTAQVVRLQDEQSFMMHLLTDGRAGGEPALPPEAEAAEPTTNPEKT